jgi:hypothetical protein
MDTKTVLWQRDNMYRQCKALLGIKQMVKRETVLDLCLGKGWEDFLHTERQNTVTSLLNAARIKGDAKREAEIIELLEGSNTQVPTLLKDRYCKVT